MSESSRVFRECPTWCSSSLFWLAFENPWCRRIPIKVRTSCTGSSPPPEHLLFCCFLNGMHYRLYWWWCCLFSFREVGFMGRRANRRVCSGHVRPGAVCLYSGSHWRNPEFVMQIRIETSWAGSNPCLNIFYFCCFLKKGGLHAGSWCFLCNARWFWCAGGLRVTGLATGQLSGSSEHGIRAVAPGESTRGVEYTERGGMW